ncbi:MAG: ABC transporter substrate-binding protein [Betaproteobacteria bacterium]|nr:ABC transporter substrate-binding protein [Betaproteobacteria bacterium]
MIKKFFAIASLMVSLTALSASAQDVAPDELVRKNTNDVLAAIKTDKDLQSGDPKKLEKLAEEKILPYFNFARMTQLAVGSGWREANDDQKKALVNEFRQLLLRTYSTTLTQYRNQTIEVKPLKVTATDTEAVVKTSLLQPGGQPIPIDYSMEKTKDGWKVYDVLIDGVSLVTNYRSTFKAEIAKSGIDGLIKSLADRNSKNTGSAAATSAAKK